MIVNVTSNYLSFLLWSIVLCNELKVTTSTETSDLNVLPDKTLFMRYLHSRHLEVLTLCQLLACRKRSMMLNITIIDEYTHLALPLDSISKLICTNISSKNLGPYVLERKISLQCFVQFINAQNVGKWDNIVPFNWLCHNSIGFIHLISIYFWSGHCVR